MSARSDQKPGSDLQVLGSGGYGRVVALDRNRVVKLQGGDPEEDGSGVAGAALREMVALRVLDRRTKTAAGRILLHPSGVVGIEIRRYHMSLLEWIQGRKRRSKAGAAGAAAATSPLLRRPILAILRDVATELAFAHARGYLHRDIKPENVMLDDLGRAHLIDWGMSRQAGASGPFAKFTPGVTTLWYRAPELFTGEAYGAAVDMWSLGVMAVELATGRCPFRGGTELEQAAHYVDVLGPPPKGALSHWPFATTQDTTEPRRAQDTWAAVPQIAAVPHLADIIDGLVRWRAADRTTAEQLLLNPALGTKPQRPGGASSWRHPPELHLAPAHAPLPSHIQPNDIRHAARRLIDACTHAKMQPLPVAWCAARLVWRTLAHRSSGSSSSRPRTLLLCLDLAAKLVGTRRPRGLNLAATSSTRSIVAAQVELIQGPLGGAAGLADAVEQACAPLDQIRPRVPDECPAPFAAAALLWTKTLLLAALRHAPDCILPVRNWERLGPTLRAFGAFVATGLQAHLVRIRVAARHFVRHTGAPHIARLILRTIARAAAAAKAPTRQHIHKVRFRQAVVMLAAAVQ